MIHLYGIANCDTVKKARAWLAAQGVETTFHDFKREGLDASRLEAWMGELGWAPLLNRQGTTWRRLDAGLQAGVVDAASAAALMLAHTSVILRPVVEWRPTLVTVGFDAAKFAAAAGGPSTR